MERTLGRRVPQDFDHVDKHPLRLTAAPSLTVNRSLGVPFSRLSEFYDQGSEGACVGFAASWAKTIIESAGDRRLHKFDATWLYRQAQLVDEWDDTPPGEGTSVRAALDILRDRGHVRVKRVAQNGGDPDPVYRVEENTWATSVDQMRACIAAGAPIIIGVNWYENFDRPVVQGDGAWIGKGNLGRIRGGHAVCIYAASDRKQAFRFTNNWGAEYPLTWLPYGVMERLLREDGEATIMVDALAPEVRVTLDLLYGEGVEVAKELPRV